jgi:hypothetical protein
MRRFLVPLALIVVLGTSSVAGAAGRKGARSSATCSVAGSTVTAVGLPTGEVINFMLTDETGTRGWVLGYTPDGTWAVAVPAGEATYAFVSRTYGRDGSRYDVFATC